MIKKIGFNLKFKIAMAILFIMSFGAEDSSMLVKAYETSVFDTYGWENLND